jgi:tRNA threonylcarbamoyladenosine biosynthesis protein TsaB
MFMDDFKASARFMNFPSGKKFREQVFENLAYFEPFYLKDFVAGKPRVKGLH